ncbi:MAG: protein kinase [Planctomycetes bacterium]|nr:protein kinase [Planctomycetota bacterium]
MTEPRAEEQPGAGGAAGNERKGAFEERSFGKYRLIRELGRGGMGVVYLAEDPQLRRKLAIKILPHSVAQEERVVQRFLREAQAAARLRHRNIIPIYSAGELEGTYYYSMEYVPGVTLAHLLRGLRERKMAQRGALVVERVIVDGQPALELVHELRTPFTGTAADHDAEREPILFFPQRNYVHEALRLFVEVADALHYAHGQGVVHRDIKPSNLLLAPDGRLLLADFGLAKIGDARSITKTGDLLGSPSYMSPEQTMTRRVPVDHRTDVWSLGVTLYEFLTLRHPFEARSLEVSLRNIVSLEPPPPRRLNPRLPKDVETILLMALEKSPERRYPTAAALAEDLRSVLNYESIQARSAGPITRSIRFVRRHSTRIVFALLAACLLAVGAFALTMLQQRKLQDIDRGIAYFQGFMESQAGAAVDQEEVAEIREELRALRKKSPSLSAAIDRLSFATIREAESHLPAQDRPGDLAAVVRALARLRLIHLHNPNEMERSRLEKVDRATAETRVLLIWAIHDRLAAFSQPEHADLHWEWLRHFLGTSEATAGLPREQNVLVRRNAVEALRRLSGHAQFGARVIPALLEVAEDAAAEPAVRCEAVNALASLDGTLEDDAALFALAGLIEKDQRFSLPPLARYRAAEVLRASGSSSGHADAFRRLLADPAAAVRALAEQTLREIESG